MVGETLYLYLDVAKEVLSAAIISEAEDGQKPIYFVSKALQGPELRYQKIEKVALALVLVDWHLRPYFVSHQVVVRIDQPNGPSNCPNSEDILPLGTC